MKEMVLAVDLGGTNLRMAVIDSEGQILFQTKGETPKNNKIAEIIQAIVESAGICQSQVKDLGQIKAVSAAVPSGVDYQNGIIVKAPNVPCLSGFRMVEELEKVLHLKVFLENDSNAAAIGENWIGASKGFQDSIMLTMGTGVGSGIIINGNILRGIDGLAGEIGHTSVEPLGVPCGCGSFGCVEQYTSATAIVRQTIELMDKFPNSEIKDYSKLTSAIVYQAGKNGDELALEVFQRMGFYLGICLSTLINTFNPEVIVLGGGVVAGWDLFIPSVWKEILKRAYQVSAARVKVVPALLGDDAGIVGAARLGFIEINRSAKVQAHS